MRLLVISILFASAGFTSSAQLLDSAALDTVRIFTSLEEALKTPEEVYWLKLKDRLETVPEELKQFKNLNVLDLSKNRLTELPEFLVDLKFLQRLDVSRNRFTFFPAQICRMTELRELIVNRNEMEGFPACIGNLTKLEYIDAWYTNIYVFPNEMQRLTNLKVLDLRETPLKESEKAELVKFFKSTKVMFSNGCDCAH